VYLGTIVLVFTIWPQSVSPLAVVAVHALCIFPELALEQVWLRAAYGAPRWPAPIGKAAALVAEALPLALALVASQLLKALGMPVLWAGGHADELGAFYLSNQCSVVATALVGAALSVLHGRLANHSRDPVVLRAHVWRATLVCGVIGVAGSLTGSYAALWVPTVFGSRFAATVPILKNDIWRLAAILAAAPLLSLLICTQRLRTFAFVHLAGLSSGLALAAWRVHSDGARGVALAIAAGHGVVFVLALIAALSQSNNERI
jgi:O-antigen/teichoic acid export membrane protein